MNLESLIANRRIVVTMGPGGVGKTTVAALLGLQAAVMGRKTLVLTIDPAMRLADALGLGKIPPGKEHIISVETMNRSSIPAKVPLAVSMLDTGRSLTGVITRETSSTEKQKRILQHPFFQRLCNDLAGSREYAAMEELLHLHLRGGYDLVVVDTPPTTHSMDFLEAPDRILDVLNNDGYRWLMRPALLAGKLGLMALDFSGGYIVRTLSKFTGLEFLRELATFLDLFSGLMEGFRQRAAAVKAVLRSAVSSFILVTTPDPGQSTETFYLHRKLSSRELAPQAVVINRVTPDPAPLPATPEWRDILVDQLLSANAGSKEFVESVIGAMESAHLILSHLSSRDRTRLASLQDRIENRSTLVAIPLLAEDIHELAGLERMRRAVFGQGRESA